jgi:uncharacterized membrane protein YvlD (DUF360 family)
VGALYRLIDFYRAQAELIWNWRRGRTHLLLRAAISFVVATVSLAATAYALPGLRIDTPLALAGAVVTIGLLSALVRPVLLAVVAPVSLTLMFLTALVFQVVSIIAVGPLVPGFRLNGLGDAIVAAAVFAVISSILSWFLSLDTDDSYYSMLVRRLLARRPDADTPTTPGLVIIQIDGLSHAVLEQQVNAGRVPAMSKLLSRNKAHLGKWTTLLPSQTSASQAGIMWGNNDGIPAFRWYEKDTDRLIVSNRAEDAEEIEARAKAGNGNRPGLLQDDGASIGNLCSGGAERCYLTLATVRDPNQGLGTSRSYFSFFLSPYGFVHAIVLGVAEMLKEIFQARRARLAGIEPYLHRGFPYPLLRAATNVILRPVSTSLVIEQMLRGTSTIYVTYTDYDEIAHHSGPQRAEALDALDGVDRTVGTLLRAAEDAPRPYRFVILSDHGQTLGATFYQRFERTLLDLVRQLMGGADSVSAAVDELEQWRVANTMVSELTRARGARTVTKRALESRDRRRLRRREAASKAQPAPTRDRPDLVVCASGNLALVYFPDIEGRADLETLDAKFPSMVEALGNHPGVGILMVRSHSHGTLVMGPRGTHNLTSGDIQGEDPLEPYGPHAKRSLERLDQMSNVGDLVLVSMVDTDTHQVAAFEELIGSHGGLGGPQTDALLLYPAEWQLSREEIVGAEEVYEQLMSWIQSSSAETPAWKSRRARRVKRDLTRAA